MPKVSICIPTYRQTAHLRKTLASIAEQTFKDVEVIITDDSPDDAVEQLVAEFAAALPRLQYARNSAPLGPPANWDHAISMARGEYIKIMHHDDRF
ncbi:MAG: glycosyltransferase, partial [Bacteroidota bacterium]|nr:glycosyltransferase [Bacteroidota bacterium]